MHTQSSWGYKAVQYSQAEAPPLHRLLHVAQVIHLLSECWHCWSKSWKQKGRTAGRVKHHLVCYDTVCWGLPTHLCPVRLVLSHITTRKHDRTSWVPATSCQDMTASSHRVTTHLPPQERLL